MDSLDPPEHRAYQRIRQPYLLAAYVDAMEPHFRALALARLELILSRGRADIVRHP